jgi:hypothetical protein
VNDPGQGVHQLALPACREMELPGSDETKIQVGDHVIWNSEANRNSGQVVKAHTTDLDYKGNTHHASKHDPSMKLRAIRPITS